MKRIILMCTALSLFFICATRASAPEINHDIFCELKDDQCHDVIKDSIPLDKIENVKLYYIKDLGYVLDMDGHLVLIDKENLDKKLKNDYTNYSVLAFCVIASIASVTSILFDKYFSNTKSKNVS